MKKQVERTTPARAEVVETVEVTVCDLCEAEQLGSWRCMVCGREVCSSCSNPDPADMGVHSSMICHKCSDIHYKYQHQIDVTEDIQKAAEAEIRAAWKEESLNENAT